MLWCGMARKPRVEFEGAIYHVMCHGNRQEPIFRDRRDHVCFLDTLGEACGRTGWRLHAFVLMGNHYHLLLETPEPNLVDGMRWFQGTYTQRFNVRHRVCGHLFRGRYKALPVDGDGNYFQTVAAYIHLNPARALCFDRKNGSLSDYIWSSYPGYVHPAQRPDWLVTDRVLGSCGWSDDSFGRAQYRTYMQERVIEILRSKDPRNADERWVGIRRGWAYGSAEFREQIKSRLGGAMDGRRRDSYSGDMARLHDESEAERLLQLGLNELGINEDDLHRLMKGDEKKCLIAWLIKKNTHVKNIWIADRLKMGNVATVSRCVKRIDELGHGDLRTLRDRISFFKD